MLLDSGVVMVVFVFEIVIAFVLCVCYCGCVRDCGYLCGREFMFGRVCSFVVGNGCAYVSD